MPSPTTLRHLIETEQDHAFLDLLTGSLSSAAATRLNVLSGWRLYTNWVRQQNLSILNADQAQAQAYKEWLSQNYEAPSTRNNRLTQARKLYQLLQEAQLVYQNPFDDLHGEINPAHERRKSYSPEEIQALLYHATSEEKLILLLGAHAGLTGIEVCALTYEQVQNDAQTIELPDRRIFCTPELTQQFQLWVKGQGDTPLFPTQPTGYIFPLLTQPQLRSKIFHLCTRSHVPYKAWQALRNAAGIKMLHERSERETVMHELGLGHRMALRPMVKISGVERKKRQKTD